MKNKGKAHYRTKDNKIEKAFSDEWEKINTDHNGKLDGMQTLDWLLADQVNNPAGEVTERDRLVAATIIQWLGSPVGSGFIKKVMSQFDD